jgi:2-dehydro-3-deoxyphosphogluconate aldolase/(4S)-4-hydroxy-2-oxoglutarate aldolase
MTVLEQIRLTGLVPVIAVQNADDAEPLARALLQGGLPSAEVTFRTAAAQEAIRRIAKAFPDMLLGAGTVLTVDQAKAASDYGAKYIVSPGLNPKVVEYCLRSSLPVTPGVTTPSDVEVALGLGLDVVKFFPAEASGGLVYLKALSGPYGNVRFIPTGGIDESNLLAYLKFPKTLACGGSWMVKPELIAAKKFDQISDLAARAVQLMLGFDLRRISVTASGESEAIQEAKVLAGFLNVPVTQLGSSLFVGTQLEIQKSPDAPRTITLGTHFLDRALAYLQRKGVQPEADGIVHKEGRAIAARLKATVGGFQISILEV